MKPPRSVPIRRVRTICHIRKEGSGTHLYAPVLLLWDRAKDGQLIRNYENINKPFNWEKVKTIFDVGDGLRVYEMIPEGEL